ncbi:MAG TPA: ATP-binding protein [Chloroflexia bacterium]|nr:ATP-binding protein [Chloroflexia bacterium]
MLNLQTDDLAVEIEKLRWRVKELEIENADLEVLLETTTEHADVMENELFEKNEKLAQSFLALEATQAQLVESEKRAQEATRAKSAFLANMSHELRTPMNAILLYSEILQDDATDLGLPDFVTDLKKIQAAGKHLLALINGILDLSKIEAGRMELYLENFSVANLVQDVVTTVKPLVDKNSNRLEVEYTPDVATMQADVTKLRQALFNLLSNATKFTENGSIRLRVERKVEDSREWYCFSVQDSGIGMTAEQMGKLFQDFSQADASTTRKYGGTGLGLAISRRFCQMMGGDISVTSRLGEGSCFTIVLPAQVRDGKAIAENAEETDRLSPVLESSAPVILVIDAEDSSVVRIQQALSLKNAPLEILTVVGLEAGMAQARALQPSFIALNLELSNKAGWELLDHLKSEAGLSSIPRLALAIPSNETILETDGDLSESFDSAALLALIKQYWTGSKSAPVLLVDANESRREALVEVLDEAGMELNEASNGSEALESLFTELPGLILLDLVMPVMNGLEFLVEMHKNPAWRAIPVILLPFRQV